MVSLCSVALRKPRTINKNMLNNYVSRNVLSTFIETKQKMLS